MAIWAERFGRNPKLDARKSASNTGSRTIFAAAITTRSRTVGIPSGRVWPGRPGLGICTRRNGWGRYDPALSSRGELIEERPHPGPLDGVDADAIDARGAPVGTHVAPRPPHHVAAGDLVKQGVESTLGILLGAAIQHALEGSNAVQAIGLSDGPSRHFRHSSASLPSIVVHR